MSEPEQPPVQAPVHPSHADPVARAWSERIGGPVGGHARPHAWWTPVRVILAVATVVCCLALVQKGPCIQTQWLNNDVRYSKMCYSDIPYLYVDRGLAEHHWPYSDSDGRYQAMEYPPGIVYVAWAASWLTVPFATGPPQSVRAHTEPDSFWGLPGMTQEINRNFLVNAVILLGVALLATFCLVGAAGPRPWDAMAFAASPTLLVTALINWDLLAVACVAGALWAWARGRPVVTGLLLGIGTAVKLYPLFLFGALLVICLRRRDLPALGRALVSGLLGWVVLNLPAVLTGAPQWRYFWHFNSERGPDLGSLWLVISDSANPISAHTVNVWSWLVFALACLGVLVLGLVAPRTPRLSQLGFLVLVAFLMVNKVYSPQYVLWLLPLAVLARPRWRDLLLWQVGELFYFGMVWLHLDNALASGTSGGGDPAYTIAILVRVVAELYLTSMIIRDVLVPEYDVVGGAPSEAPESDQAQSTTTRSNPVVV
ncbi:DUF2029 domain-containing protein [Nocardioides mangrovicus]|uniref:DUF2029 domain-containing protein n=1 Tax=Nocardioides mangrovicus TaxID=2478913 RepID=A0A3L8P137_9ACTN|nr:glycosyltransferase 87 family protein [Nocardioides mangrovicus]RLV48108.1 DUF2029 domain-containing protein [Nocardioides mangrovicus]